VPASGWSLGRILQIRLHNALPVARKGSVNTVKYLTLIAMAAAALGLSGCGCCGGGTTTSAPPPATTTGYSK
jgi:hypothetical protein